MNLDQFIKQELDVLNSFYGYWLDSHAHDPESYLLDQDNLATWDEQLEMYKAFLLEEGLT